MSPYSLDCIHLLQIVKIEAAKYNKKNNPLSKKDCGYYLLNGGR